jgi:hypothetical protein
MYFFFGDYSLVWTYDELLHHSLLVDSYCISRFLPLTLSTLPYITEPPTHTHTYTAPPTHTHTHHCTTHTYTAPPAHTTHTVKWKSRSLCLTFSQDFKGSTYQRKANSYKLQRKILPWCSPSLCPSLYPLYLCLYSLLKPQNKLHFILKRKLLPWILCGNHKACARAYTEHGDVAIHWHSMPTEGIQI